jgi:hypothetical protein
MVNSEELIGISEYPPFYIIMLSKKILFASNSSDLTFVLCNTVPYYFTHNRLKCRWHYSIKNTCYMDSLQNLIVWNIELTCCQHEAEKLKPRAVYHIKNYFIDHVHFIQDFSCNTEIQLSVLIRPVYNYSLPTRFIFQDVWNMLPKWYTGISHFTQSLFVRFHFNTT